MTLANDARGAMDDAQTQIERLREQVEALMKERVTPAIADFAGRAEAAANSASDAVKHQADAVAGRVRQQPLVAILVAAAVGWIIGRTMR